MKKIIYLFTIVVSIQTKAQTNIRIGGKAPNINVTDWVLNVPVNKDLLHKNIVLEFWATWCGPCIAAVPHLNELQDKMGKSDLYFYSITDESIEKINRILKRVNFKSVVVSDQTKKTQISFGDGKSGLEIFPLTVLIDKKGIIRWIGEPKDLTENILQNFLENKLINPKNDDGKTYKSKLEEGTVKIKTEESQCNKFMDIVTNNDLLYYFDFRITNTQTADKTKIGDYAICYSSTSLKELYSDLFSIDLKDIIVPENISGKKYFLQYKNPKKNTESLILLEGELLNILNLTKRTEVQEVNIYSASVKNKNLLDKALDESFSSKSDAGDKIIFTSYTITNLFSEINTFSSERFSFKSELTGNFDFIISNKSTAEIIKSLESYGFELSKEKVNAKVIILETKK